MSRSGDLSSSVAAELFLRDLRRRDVPFVEHRFINFHQKPEHAPMISHCIRTTRTAIAAVVLGTAAFAVLGTSASAQTAAGWQSRVDRSTNASDPDGPGGIQFMAMGGGFHVVAPAAGVFWHPSNTATGTYTVKGTFALNKPSGHVNYYGLVFGGASLDGPQQNYLYFLIGQNGTFIVKHRAGDATTHDVQARTPHDAIKRPDSTGKSVNALEVRVGADKIDYVVNGTVVHSTPKTGMTAKTDGLYGFRINHQLDVLVTAISKGN